MVSMVILNYNDWELTAEYSRKISSMNIVAYESQARRCHSYI